MSAGATIYAVSSGALPAAIAIIRISGPAAFDVAAALIGPLPAARRAVLRAVRHPHDKALLDRALVLIFPAPHTATGEDLVEFHVHGGKAVVAAVEAAIATFPQTRRAEAGEFTRRALENGLVDLTGAEGLADLLMAETETQRRAAMGMAEGGLRSTIDAWALWLVNIAARVEAQLDFSDEDDVTDDGLDVVADSVAALAGEIHTLLQQPPVERLRDGVRVVIAGPPNSGKSTLLNALTGREAAIVSPVSGTTRDRIEAPVGRSGIAYLFTDTAGITETPADDIERIGIGLAQAAVTEADVVLWLGDDAPSRDDHVRVHSRADVVGRHVPPSDVDISISAATMFNIDSLWNLIESRAIAMMPHEGAVVTNARQRILLAQAFESLQRASGSRDLLVLADELRVALNAMNAITGNGGVEDVLDAVFSTFCIGK